MNHKKAISLSLIVILVAASLVFLKSLALDWRYLVTDFDQQTRNLASLLLGAILTLSTLTALLCLNFEILPFERVKSALITTLGILLFYSVANLILIKNATYLYTLPLAPILIGYWIRTMQPSHTQIPHKNLASSTWLIGVTGYIGHSFYLNPFLQIYELSDLAWTIVSQYGMLALLLFLLGSIAWFRPHRLLQRSIQFVAVFQTLLLLALTVINYSQLGIQTIVYSIPVLFPLIIYFYLIQTPQAK